MPFPRPLRATLLAGLLAVACGRDNGRTTSLADADGPTQAELLVLRIPQTGGTARILGYPEMDSTYWSAPRVTGTERALGLAPEAGIISIAGTNGFPYRLDLRLGGVERASQIALRNLQSPDGITIYGTTANGTIHRLSSQSSWTYRVRKGLREIIPLPDRSLLIAIEEGKQLRMARLRPPDTTLVDTIAVEIPREIVRTDVGDRLYLASGRELVGIRARDLTTASRLRMDRPIRTVAPTPSGDRVYVVEDSSATLVVVDRYRDEVVERIELPGIASDARMDPFGRYVLVRAARGDSAWVIAVGSERVLGSIRTDWRPDIPTVSLDGVVVTADGRDVVLLEPETLRPRKRVAGGARDAWFLFAWDGFRPRATGLDVPVDFGVTDTVPPDTGGPLFAVDSTGTPIEADTGVRPVATRPEPEAPAFTVSFAALLQEESAQRMADEIRAGSMRARVVPSEVQGATVYRVILGPYRTRADAERAARSTGRPFWIYQGPP